MHLINERKGLHHPNSLREEAEPKPASLGLNGPVTPTGGKKLEQVVGRVRRVNRNFTGSVTQPSVIKRCNGWKANWMYTDTDMYWPQCKNTVQATSTATNIKRKITIIYISTYYVYTPIYSYPPYTHIYCYLIQGIGVISG